MEGASAPVVFPTLPLSPFLPSGCVYAVVSLPLSSVSFRCWLISQESRVPLPQPVPSSSFYLGALFSGYVRSAALDAFSKHNELGPAQLSTARETQHLLPTCSDCPGRGWLVLASRRVSLVPSAHFCPLGTEAAGLCPRAPRCLEGWWKCQSGWYSGNPAACFALAVFFPAL